MYHLHTRAGELPRSASSHFYIIFGANLVRAHLLYESLRNQQIVRLLEDLICKFLTLKFLLKFLLKLIDEILGN